MENETKHSLIEKFSAVFHKFYLFHYTQYIVPNVIFHISFPMQTNTC